MNKNDLSEDVKEALIKLLRKASYDSSFREICLEQPEQAFNQISDKKWPGHLTLTFVEKNASTKQTEDTIVIELPPFEKGRLNDDELDTISGGCSVAISQSIVICIE